ncbi:fucolectin-1-like [Nelusetta ayraudi]|uniref:fucolectin-1-like n=1 Tax=Nelusetta ayraudi TaxID=303726 RepID=UPI003F70D2B0
MSPDKAIDGNSNTNWNHQSCSSTLNNKSPWWRLDLLKTHKINTVTVTIREDGHYFRINGAEIRIGNSLEDNGNLNPKCAVISKPAPGSTNTYNCKGMEGRYVNIVIPSQMQILTLCEVKVTGQCSEKPAPNEKNIANGGVATQSSQHGSASPDKAIDGNHDSDWNHGSCSSTINDMSPWWRLDLLKPYQIKTVTVTIRNDRNYRSITGAEIRIGNSLDNNGNLNPRCAVISDPAPGSTDTFNCSGIEGRYINIVIPGKRQYLTLCEVKVTGQPSEKPAPPDVL